MASSHEDSGEKDARLDALFAALADEQRRLVVRYFQSAEDDVATVTDLIDHAAEDASGEQSRDHLETRFHHVTFPKLADLEVIEYDPRNRTVRYRGSPELERVLGVVDEAESSAE